VFQDVAARQRRARQLATLLERLAALRVAFGPCLQIVQDNSGQAYLIPIDQLRFCWNQVQNNQLAALRPLFAGPAGERPVWFDELTNKSETIRTQLAVVNLGGLAASVPALAAYLAQLESQVRMDLGQALDDLVSLSDRTLGKLSAGD
jgi:hypothetical protein